MVGPVPYALVGYRVEQQFPQSWQVACGGALQHRAEGANRLRRPGKAYFPWPEARCLCRVGHPAADQVGSAIRA